MFTIRKLVIGVPLLVVAGIAAQVVFSSKTAGSMVSATWVGSLSSTVQVIPADTGDATAYFVFWQGCSPESTADHYNCTFASGLAPRSAIKAQRVETLGLDLDISILSVLFSQGGQQCNLGACTPYAPGSVPLHGTFTIVRGAGSSVEQLNGSQRFDAIIPVYPVYSNATFSMSESFSGSRTRYSAIFTGVVGLATVTPPAMGSNATLTFMNGQQSFQTVYPAQ
jgi:hypothetical protein